MLVKIYGATSEGAKGRYSPAECIGAEKRTIEGKPDLKHISTSYAKRQNLTMRMQMLRFTRLTNAFSKKFENHMQMVALYTVWYNFVKQHKSLKGLSPAMAAGVSETLWSMTDLAEMIDASLPKPGRRGPYQKARQSMRTFGIWVFGLLAAGIAGSIIALALIRPPAGDGQFLTFFGGFLSGTFAFACARLWFAEPSKNSH